MKKYRSLVITLLQSMFEYLLFLPILLIIGILMMAYQPLWIWLASLLVSLFIGVVYRTLFPKQKWGIYLGIAVVIGVLPGIIFGKHVLVWIVSAIIHPIVIYRGMMYASRTWKSLLPTSFLWAGGFPIYFVSYFAFRYIDILHPYLTLITIGGAVLVIMTLFISNNERLKTSTLSEEENPYVSRTIKKQNRLFLVITVAVIALLVGGYKIQDAFKAALLWFIGLFSGSSAEEEVIESTPPPSNSGLPFEGEKESSAILKFLEVIAMYAVYILLAVALVFLISLFVKKMRTWLKKVMYRFLSFLKQMVSRPDQSETSTGYVDEKESIFNWKEWKKEQQEKAKGFVKHIFKGEPSWESLSNQQKVRYIYRRFLLPRVKDTNYKTTNTPRETLEKLKDNVSASDEHIDELREAYEQSRYGNKDIDEDKMKKIYLLLKQK